VTRLHPAGWPGFPKEASMPDRPEGEATMTGKPLSAAELREALRLVAAELEALGTPPVVLVGAAREADPAEARRREARMEAYCRTLGALLALVPDVASNAEAWPQRWALGKLRERAAGRPVREEIVR
jgi:hypothetical protein